MHVKTILVCLNAVERTDELLKVAADLAARHEAHLVGLFVIPGVQIYAVPGGVHGAIDINQEQRAYYEAQADPVHAKFEDIVRKSAVVGEWRCVQAETHHMAKCALEHCLRADLIVAAQSPEAGFDGFEPEFAERIIMETGRPVLVVPREGRFETIATHVVVGWNNSPQAARASSDALALLQKADQVTIVSVNPDDEAGREDLPGAEFATMLSRHGVTVTTETVSATSSAGEALLTKASDLGANLLVVGAYGHSRLREYVFGGVTKHLLQHMTVPVLMSH